MDGALSISCRHAQNIALSLRLLPTRSSYNRDESRLGAGSYEIRLLRQDPEKRNVRFGSKTHPSRLAEAMGGKLNRGFAGEQQPDLPIAE